MTVLLRVLVLWVLLSIPLALLVGAAIGRGRPSHASARTRVHRRRKAVAAAT